MNKEQHEKWLRKHGVHPDQLKGRKKYSNKPKDFGVAKDYYGNLSNTIAPPVLVNSIWEQVRLHPESDAVMQAINEKRSRVGPAYNKGGLQLLPKKEIIYSGKK